MSQMSSFVGSIPRTYHACLGPLLFEGYARDITARLRPRPGDRILELAAGTGIVSARIAAALPQGATLTVTDLNEAMLDVARESVGAAPRVQFQKADACALPFADASFDAIVSQFGVMFFPDKLKAMQEARRVLAPGGRYIFNVWDSLEQNPISRLAHETLAELFPDNPPLFLAAAPFGYYNRAEIERVLRAAGFNSVRTETVGLVSRAECAEDAARGLLEGSPMFLQLQERGVQDTAPVRKTVAAALARHFGDRPCVSTMRAIVVEAA